MSWSTRWQLKLEKAAVDMFAFAGDLRQSRMRWDVQAMGPSRSQIVMRSDLGFE